MTQVSVSITVNAQKEFSPGTCLDHRDIIRLFDQEVLLRTTEHVGIGLSILVKVRMTRPQKQLSVGERI